MSRTRYLSHYLTDTSFGSHGSGSQGPGSRWVSSAKSGTEIMILAPGSIIFRGSNLTPFERRGAVLSRIGRTSNFRLIPTTLSDPHWHLRASSTKNSR